MRKKENKRGKDKERVPLDTKGSVPLPGSLGEREKKKHTSSEEGGGDGGIVPSFLTHCVCVCMCVCKRETVRAYSGASQSIQKKANTFRP